MPRAAARRPCPLQPTPPAMRLPHPCISYVNDATSLRTARRWICPPVHLSYDAGLQPRPPPFPVVHDARRRPRPSASPIVRDARRRPHSFASPVSVVWVLFDNLDGMPRYYAKIKGFDASNFKFHLTWLERIAMNEAEEKWSDEELPVACGSFSLGTTDISQDRLMFSHIVSWKENRVNMKYIPVRVRIEGFVSLFATVKEKSDIVVAPSWWSLLQNSELGHSVHILEACKEGHKGKDGAEFCIQST
ncbi:putative J domain-containing protein C17A3.05c [Hordeum vulgare]|nr:putative J domain-containing protein C17A3.05c [Hordeum vulgare]